MKIRRLFVLLLTLALVLALSVSCSFGNGDGSSDGGGGQTGGSGDTGDSDQTGGSGDTGDSDQTDGTDKPAWSPDTPLGIVKAEGSDAHITKITDALLSSGFNVRTLSEGEAALEHELVIGDVERGIAYSAYKRLNRIDEEDPSTSCWLIYSDGASISIAYDSDYALSAATDYLIERLSTEGTLPFTEGFVATEAFEKGAWADSKRTEAREMAFLSIEEELGEDVAESIRTLFSLIGSDTYTWLANLYDPVLGGFYYSNSGRDTDGYLPDLESTWQAIRHLEHRGMFVDYGNDMALGLPSEIIDSIVSFTRELQKPNGYFYHPQWENTNDTRLGRDLSWAKNILVAFGAQPYYSTTNGLVGIGNANAPVSARLSASSAAMVSRVVAASSASLPSYLRSIGKWSEYLDSLDISSNSYSAGNKLNAIHDQILEAGTQFVDYLIEYLNEKQYPDNGLWEQEISYNAVNGLMKISLTYAALGASMNRIDEALDSSLQIALDPKLPENAGIVSTYNPWVSMQNLIAATPLLSKDEMRARVLNNADRLAAVTVQKLARYYKDDGSFSYLELYSASASQGMPVALPNSREGDVNATTIACSTIDIMCDVLGVDAPPFYCSTDYSYFTEMLLGMGEIVKDDNFQVEGGPITFDDYAEVIKDETGGILNSYSNRVSSTVDTKKDGEKADGSYKWFGGSIVQNPNPLSEPGDLVYKVNTYTDPENPDKQTASANMTTSFALDTSARGNTFIFDADIMVASNDSTSYSSSTLLQIFFDNTKDSDKTFSINISTSQKNGVACLKLGDNYAGLDGSRNLKLVDGIPMNEWFNLRVECYKIYDGNETLSVKGKIFVNGVYCAESDAGEVKTGAKEYTDADVSRVRVGFYRSNCGEYYFNNVVAETSKLTFVSQEPEPVANPATFDKFNQATGNIYEPEENVTNKAHDTVTYEIVTDPLNVANKVMKVTKTENAGSNDVLSTLLALQTEKADGRLYVFEADIYMAGLSVTSWLDFSFVNQSGAALTNLRLGASGGSIKIRENVSSIEGNVDIKTNVAQSDSWFTLGIVLDYVDAENVLLDVYINGALIIENLNAYNTANSAIFTVSDFRIRYLSSGKVTAYLDNLVFKRSDGYKYNGGHVIGESSTGGSGSDSSGSGSDSGISSGGVIGFDSFDPASGDVMKPAATLTNSATESGTSYEITEDPTDSTNKVMLVTDAAGTTKSYSQLSLYVIDEGVYRYVFESDIYIDSAGTAEATEGLGIAFMGKDNKILSKVFVGVESGKVKIVESNTFPTEGYVVFGKDLAGTDEWFNLRLELTYSYNSDGTINKDSVLLSAYVNDLPVGELNTYNDARWTGSNATGYTVNGVHIGYEKTTALKIYFDDISLTQKASESTTD